METLFADVSPNSPYYPYFAYVYKNNIVLPTEENYYKPAEHVTRAEIAVFNYRLLFEEKLTNDFRILSTLTKCKATVYSDFFDGRGTANGEIFHQDLKTAASLTLPFGTQLKLTSPDGTKSVIVKINDRGPYDDRFCLDLSRSAFETFANTNAGWTWINYEIIN